MIEMGICIGFAFIAHFTGHPDVAATYGAAALVISGLTK